MYLQLKSIFDHVLYNDSEKVTYLVLTLGINPEHTTTFAKKS